MRSRRIQLALAATALAAIVLALLLARRPRSAPDRDAAAAAPGRDEGDEPAARVAALRGAGRGAPPGAARDAGAVAPGALGAFEGRVVSALDGSPAPRAAVALVHEGRATSVRADDRGAFRFVPTEPGAYTVEGVTADGFAPFAPELGHGAVVLVARPGAPVRDVVLALAPLAAYVVAVLDPAGAPVAGARLRVTTESGADALQQGPLETDARGEARVRAPDRAVVEARHPSYGAGRAVVASAARAAGRVVVRLAERAGDGAPGAIEGTVTGPSGEPVEGALVTVRSAGAVVAARGSTGPDGAFVFDDVAPGHYSVDAAAGSLVARGRHVFLRPGQRASAPIAMQAGASIRGVVRHARTRAPVTAFTVTAAPRDAGSYGAVPAVAVVDAEGRFEITGLATGPFRVRATAAGYAPSAPAFADVVAGGAPAEVELAVDDGATLAGRVLDARTRAPVAGARVTLEHTRDALPQLPLPAAGVALTSARGDYELRDVPTGVTALRVVAQGYHPRLVASVRVAEGGAGQGPTVELTPLGEGEAPRTELGGVGANLRFRPSGELTVVSVAPGGPAAAAGLRAGDVVTQVDGEAVPRHDLDAVTNRVRGPEGSAVALTVRRAGDGGAEDVTVRATRQRIASGM